MRPPTLAPHYVSLPGDARLSFGADEFVFVELSEAMDLGIALQVQAITSALTAALDSAGIDAVTDIVPAHVSYMLRVDPDRIDPRELVPVLESVHSTQTGASTPTIPTRILQIPILYDDPWTRETVARFRDRHPSPEETDLAYTARLNGYDTTHELVQAHSTYPYIVTFNNFIPGNAESVQLVPQHMQIQAPKYLSPRTDTPERSLGHGGNQATIYPVHAPGGFQLLGRAAVPVLDFTVTGPGFTDSPALLPAGTVVKYDPVDLSGYEEIQASVEANTYTPSQAEIEFDLAAFDADPLGYARRLVDELP